MLRFMRTRYIFGGKKSMTLDMGALNIQDCEDSKRTTQYQRNLAYTERDVPMTIKASALE